jgi:hypothetical protein
LRRDDSGNRERILEAAGGVLAEQGLDCTLDDNAHHTDGGVGPVHRRSMENALVDAPMRGVDEMVDRAVQ